jgi:hypothetical protein
VRWRPTISALTSCPLVGRSSSCCRPESPAVPDNLDSSEIQDWAYTRVKDENPDWLGDFDEDIDRDRPMRWLTQRIGIGVLMRRQLMDNRRRRRSGVGSAAASVAVLDAGSTPLPIDDAFIDLRMR